MSLRALLLAAALMPCGFAVGAEDAPAEGDEAEPLPYVEVTVTLNSADYLAVIDISGADPVVVNGAEMDVSDHVPGAVRIARADGLSMADEAYRAREVLLAACGEAGFRADTGVVPVLSPAGRWVFVGGCE